MKRCGLLCFFMMVLLMIGTSCDAIGDVANKASSKPVATVTNILFSTNPKATHVVFDVEVKPGDVSPNTTYYVCLLSRDGYFFEYQSQPVRWTEEELKGAAAGERNYSIIQVAEEKKIKRFTLGAPFTDKDVVALRNDCKLEAEKLAEEYAREIWGDLLDANLVEFFKDAGKEPDFTEKEINTIFNRHMKLVVADKEGYLKIRYPDGEIAKLGSFSGQGSFKTPLFTPKYKWLRITILSPEGCMGEGGLYYSSGQGSQWGTLNIQPNNGGKPVRMPVQPGKEYYYTFKIPEDINWQLIIEESNMDTWIEEMK